MFLFRYKYEIVGVTLPKKVCTVMNGYLFYFFIFSSQTMKFVRTNWMGRKKRPFPQGLAKSRGFAAKAQHAARFGAIYFSLLKKAHLAPDSR